LILNGFKGKKILELNAEIQHCSKCMDLVNSRSRVVNGYGDLNADVLVVGEAPGRLGADITGIPFTRDRSGQLLQKMLNMIGLNDSPEFSDHPRLKNVYLTNIVRCNPKGKNNINRSPTCKEIANCNDYLKLEIEVIDPYLIIPLGLRACKSILGKDFNGKSFGKFIKKDERVVIPLWHPAYVIRGGGKQKLSLKKYRYYFLAISNFLAIKGTS
jgi:uracil-DNA glycosylase family 4